MRHVLVLLLVLALAACVPRTVVVVRERQDIGVEAGLQHSVFASDLGCSAVDVGGGLVVTAAHCVDDLDPGDQTTVGMLVYSSLDRDFAVLFDTSRLDNPRPCLRKPSFGEHVYAIGWPVQLATDKQELTVTDGIVSGPSDDVGSLRFTAPIYFGNSGGGVWGEDGALVGISVSGFLRLPGMNFMVSASDVIPHLPR